jgi:acyl carrier protein
LLDPQGELRPINSLDMVDLVVSLEQAVNKMIDPLELRAENFNSIADVSAMMLRVLG